VAEVLGFRLQLIPLNYGEIVRMPVCSQVVTEK
jgi:hypothetical protein